MAVNITSIKTSSNGLWQGDDPLHFAFPLLIVQATLVLVLSRLLSFALRPLRQPKVIAEIVGGIILGPSAFGRNATYLNTLFPSWSTPILESVASIGLLFFLFLVGLELDLRSIRLSGRRAFSIAAAGISLPFISGIGVAVILRRSVPGADAAGYAPFLVFMGVSLSITAFPVLARILAELKLLTTEVGETAMAAAAFNDVAAWVLLALAVALSGGGGGGGHRSPLVSVWVLLCGVAFVAVEMALVRPAMAWVARRAEGEAGGISESWVCLTLTCVLISGFFTDLIGIHSIFGAFVFGLTIPKDGEFAGRLIERIEDFVSGLLLPLYFASSGLKTDVTKIQGMEAWGLLAMVIATACFGKIMGTLGAALLCRIPVREAATLGVLMNTKGLVELIVLNIGKERKVLNDEIFAILVLMALFTTFITTPTVMAIYKPARCHRHPINHRKLQGSFTTSSPPAAIDSKELRILACVHSQRDIPSIINLIETVRGGGTKKLTTLKLYIMHLVELTERSSSILLVRRFRRNGLPFRNPLKRNGGRSVAASMIDVAFEAYGQLSKVRVRPMTAVSAMASMHADVCNVAEEKKVSLLVVPFHKHKAIGVHDTSTMENVGHGWRLVNQKILKEAPCSVGVLVDRGLGGGEQVGPAELAREVCVVFFGGPDDREALELAGRMAEHPGVRVTAVRFVEEKRRRDEERTVAMLRPSPMKCKERSYAFSTATMDRQREKELDEEAVAAFQQKTEGLVRYQESPVGNVLIRNVLDAVLSIGKSGEYELIVVGKGRFPSSMVAELAATVAEHPELGPIGDALASSHNGVVSSVLVIQQHDLVHSEETPAAVVYDCGDVVVDVGHEGRETDQRLD